jgi:hypothetical protein
VLPLKLAEKKKTRVDSTPDKIDMFPPKECGLKLATTKI